MIDIVHTVDFHRAGLAFFVRENHRIAAVTQGHENLHCIDDVFVCERVFTHIGRATETAINLHAADARKLVGLRFEEKALKEPRDGIFRRGFARAHHAINGNLSRKCIGCIVQPQGARDVAAAI